MDSETESAREAKIAAWRDTAWLLALCAFLFLFRLGDNGLFDLDEGLYAEAAREMRLTGDYVTPRVNAIAFFEKPPLVYWLSAGSQAALGRNEFAARLPSALATILLAFAIFWFGSRVVGRRAGITAAVCFALSPLVFGAARQLTLDATLDIWVSLALFCYFFAWREAGARARWLIAFWVCAAMGTLAKGAPGIVIPCAAAVLHFVLVERPPARRIARAAIRPPMLLGYAAFLLIAVPWHYAAWKSNGSLFTDEYLVRQHLARFRGGDTSHLAPFWFYVPVFLALFFPWSFVIPAAIRDSVRELRRPQGAGAEPRDRRSFILLLLLWMAIVFVLFSASGSKLVSYILPLFPPSALLVGIWLDAIWHRGEEQRLIRPTGAAALACGILCAATLFNQPIVSLVERFSRRPVRVDEGVSELFTVAAILFGVGACMLFAHFVLLRRQRRGQARFALAAGLCLFYGVAILAGLPAIDRVFQEPLQSLARIAGRQAQELAINAGPPRRPSVLFYLQDYLLPNRAGLPTRAHEVQGMEGLLDYVRSRPESLVLTSQERADELAAEFDIAPVAATRGWALIRALRRPGAVPHSR